MSTETQVQFTDGEHTLFGTWSIPESRSPKTPLVILLSGDSPKGSNGLTWVNISRKLRQSGIATFRFDFTGLGASPGCYEKITLTLGRKNFRGAMRYINSLWRMNGNIGIIGASYGGNIALLESSDFQEIKALGLKSPSAFLPEGYEKQYGAEFMKKWGEDGYHPDVGLNYTSVLDSLFHNTFEAASKIAVPVRIVHGTEDTAVPIRHARDLVRILPNASIYEMEGADHWYDKNDEWELMANDLVNFMRCTL